MTLLKSLYYRDLFFPLKMFYHPKGDAYHSPIVFTYILSPDGRCEAYPLGVQLFLLMLYFGLGKVYWIPKTNRVSRVFFARKCFIPRREMHGISIRGPIVFTYVLFWVRKRILDFQFTNGFLPF